MTSLDTTVGICSIYRTKREALLCGTPSFFDSAAAVWIGPVPVGIRSEARKQTSNRSAAGSLPTEYVIEQHCHFTFVQRTLKGGRDDVAS